jgi:hypothetical protein
MIKLIAEHMSLLPDQLSNVQQALRLSPCIYILIIWSARLRLWYNLTEHKALLTDMAAYSIHNITGAVL